MSAFVIDAFEFCRTGGYREGVTPVTEMARLAADCANNSGEISWSIQGGSTPQGYPTMTLSVAGPVQLVCQRCLAPFDYHIDSSTQLVLGRDDEEADSFEEVLDDDSIDVIVGSHAADIRELLEDEALLALPQAPKHQACPDTTLLETLKSEKVSPFAGLKNLKSE
ncbi:YceD family protein [Massilia niabensis]|uniref:Large ribosomal RNA subunit accumulation protein YceD n=1 Tax=Massilia niabensis TaxID=544910 RepID=A0ABW0LBV3_9BURK